ncbi:CG2 omega domain protein [Vibrio sp. CAU 1672]|uniref:CG2 omega domain protein n=1 Tax=Vibrio sp. CAU 1672 TaxID=3032594 RepID=UPI0023D9BB95|nr:CG2 omega domain protein [Vibrio sp. CAU 1672]MDF2153773.1 CG2 omega domain protein [Vibrio sp. CAU 1672]
MKNLLLIAALLVPVATASAEVKVSGKGIELSKDCVRVEGENVSIKSDDCKSGKYGDREHENRSIHGDNNPGQGHNKDKKGKKDK